MNFRSFFNNLREPIYKDDLKRVLMNGFLYAVLFGVLAGALQFFSEVYIGLTTETIEKRWKNHIHCVGKVKRHLYYAMEKYGIENFTIEEIDKSDNFKTLGELERKYIKEYNSTNEECGYNNTHGGESNQLDANPRARLTVGEVMQIREIYS